MSVRLPATFAITRDLRLMRVLPDSLQDISEVYLAEPVGAASAGDLPARVAIKIACDKSEWFPGEYTPELAVDIFATQKGYLRIIERAGGHPLVVKGYPDVLPSVPDTLVASAACTDPEELRRVCNPHCRVA